MSIQKHYFNVKGDKEGFKSGANYMFNGPITHNCSANYSFQYDK